MSSDQGLTRKAHTVSRQGRLRTEKVRPDLSNSIIFARSFLQSKLPPEVNRILYVRNLPFTITAEELYAIFGKYGAIFQIRLGDKEKDTKGTAFVVYEDIYDAKSAVDHLSGFNVGGRYLIVLYYQPAKFQKRAQLEEKQKEVDELRKRVQQHKTRLAK
jgi:pre-mRNA branch site protein p14